MKQCFDLVKNRMLEGLAESGYTLRSENQTDSELSFVATSEKETIKVVYSVPDKLFVLWRKPLSADGADDSDEMVKAQSYIFNMSAGDGVREAAGVANEFLDTLRSRTSSAVAAAQQQKKRKSRSSDETAADFFVNRIPSVMPECREPLVKHKAHYEQLLPRLFCEEVVVVAMRSMLRNGDKKKIKDFFNLLDSTYIVGDLDTKSIIMQVLMASIDDERDVEYISGLVSADFKKSWTAAKKYFGKDVKPEKLSAMAKIAQYQGSTLNQR